MLKISAKERPRRVRKLDQFLIMIFSAVHSVAFDFIQSLICCLCVCGFGFCLFGFVCFPNRNHGYWGKKTKPTSKLSKHAKIKSFSLEELTDSELRISCAISKLLLTGILFISQLKYPSSLFA